MEYTALELFILIAVAFQSILLSKIILTDPRYGVITSIIAGGSVGAVVVAFFCIIG